MLGAKRGRLRPIMNSYSIPKLKRSRVGCWKSREGNIMKNSWVNSKERRWRRHTGYPVLEVTFIKRNAQFSRLYIHPCTPSFASPLSVSFARLFTIVSVVVSIDPRCPYRNISEQSFHLSDFDVDWLSETEASFRKLRSRDKSRNNAVESNYTWKNRTLSLKD